MSFPQLETLGDSALLLRLGDRVEDALNLRVHRLAERIRALRHPKISDVVPSYAAVTVFVDPSHPEGWAELESELLRLMHLPGDDTPVSTRVVEVPVHYGGEDGPDLALVAECAGLTPEEVVQRHAAGHYRVHFLGFSPGFPYLAGLEPVLATPRRPSRDKVPAGSVGIGGAQTGVYPQQSSGGWNLLGRTDLQLFDPQADPPCLLRPGDIVRFVELP